MTVQRPVGDTDHVVAAEVATAAAVLLRCLRAQARRGDLSTLELRGRGDNDANELIIERLGRLRPDDAVLSEEAVDDKSRLSAERVWIVDPLDGTREFGDLSRSDWAVHVALWRHGDLIAGAVALPALNLTVATPIVTDGAAESSRSSRPRLVVSRTRPTRSAAAIAAALDAEQVPMGSAGAKAMAVVRGKAEIYAHSGGQYEWDSAAPVAVARACGLHTSRLDGSALEYNRLDPYLPDLLICVPEYADAAIAAAAGR